MEVESSLEDGTFNGSPNASWNWAFTAPSSPQSDWKFTFDSGVPGPITEFFGLAIFETTAQFREEHYDVQYFWTWTHIDIDGPNPEDFYELHEQFISWRAGDLPNFIIVPEPVTGLLVLAGAATLLLRRRARK